MQEHKTHEHEQSVKNKKPSLPFGLWVVLSFAIIQGLLLSALFAISLAQFSILNILFLAIYLYIAWAGIKLTLRRDSKGVERLFLLFTLNVINIAFDFVDGISLSNDWLSLLLLALNILVLFHLNFLRIYFLDFKLVGKERLRDIIVGSALLLLALGIAGTIIAQQVIPQISEASRIAEQCSAFTGKGLETCRNINILLQNTLSLETCTAIPDMLESDCRTALALQTGNTTVCSSRSDTLCRAFASRNETLCTILAPEIEKYCVTTLTSSRPSQK